MREPVQQAQPIQLTQQQQQQQWRLQQQQQQQQQQWRLQQQQREHWRRKNDPTIMERVSDILNPTKWFGK